MDTPSGCNQGDDKCLCELSHEKTTFFTSHYVRGSIGILVMADYSPQSSYNWVV